jgi:ribokinase
MRVLNYGSLNIDLTFSVDHIVLPGETLSSSSFARGAGGKGANQSAALGKAGVSVFHAGKVGPDGAFLIRLLNAYGVDTSYIRIGDGSTGQAIIQLDKHSQNAILLYPGSNTEITQNEIDETLAQFSAGDWLVLQNEICHVGYLIQQAHRHGMSVCFNPAPFNNSIFNLPLEMVDLLVVNEIEGAGLAGWNSLPQNDQSFWVLLNELTARYSQAETIITAGKLGAYYGHETMRVKGDIVNLPVADTTGAGDTFIGYFLAAKLRGLSIDESMQKACLASSLAVSRSGAMVSIPHAEEVF